MTSSISTSFWIQQRTVEFSSEKFLYFLRNIPLPVARIYSHSASASVMSLPDEFITFLRCILNRSISSKMAIVDDQRE